MVKADSDKGSDLTGLIFKDLTGPVLSGAGFRCTIMVRNELIIKHGHHFFFHQVDHPWLHVNVLPDILPAV